MVRHVERLCLQQSNLAGVKVTDVQAVSAGVFRRGLSEEDARSVRVPAEVVVCGFLRQRPEVILRPVNRSDGHFVTV